MPWPRPCRRQVGICCSYQEKKSHIPYPISHILNPKFPPVANVVRSRVSERGRGCKDGTRERKSSVRKKNKPWKHTEVAILFRPRRAFDSPGCSKKQYPERPDHDSRYPDHRKTMGVETPWGKKKKNRKPTLPPMRRVSDRY